MISKRPLIELLKMPTRNGLTKPKKIRGHGYKMVSMGEIFAHSRISNIDMERVPVTSAEMENYVLEKNDLLFARQSLVLEGAGKCSIIIEVKEPVVFESHLIRVRIDEKIANPMYVYYFFNSPFGRKYMMTIVEQVAAAGIRARDLVKLYIPYPSVDVQNKIVVILQFIDDKIECNAAINKNLEEQALTLFRKWFVHFEFNGECSYQKSVFGSIPSNFNVVKVGSIPALVTDYVSNGSFASLKENVTLYQEPNYAYFIRNTDLKSGLFGVYVDQHSYDFLSKSSLFGGELIISNVGDVGSVFLCPTLDRPMTLGNNVIMIRPEERGFRYYLYIWFKYLQGQTIIQGIKGGSAQPKFNKTDFKNTPLLLPPATLLHTFDKVVSPMFEVISENHAQNHRLANLRELLLPRLMSGELDVSNIEL